MGVFAGPRPDSTETLRPRQTPPLGRASHPDAAPGGRGHATPVLSRGCLWSRPPRPPDGFKVWHGGVSGDDRTESERERGCLCALPALQRRAAPQPALALSPRGGSEVSARPAHLQPRPGARHILLSPAARKSRDSAPPRPPRCPYVTSCPCGRWYPSQGRGDKEPVDLTGETSLLPWALLSLVKAVGPQALGRAFTHERGAATAGKGTVTSSPSPQAGGHLPVYAATALPGGMPPPGSRQPRVGSPSASRERGPGADTSRQAGWAGPRKAPLGSGPRVRCVRGSVPPARAASAPGRGPRAIVHSSPVWPDMAAPEPGQR